MTTRSLLPDLVLALGLAAAPLAALADTAPPSGVLVISASASVEVANDVLAVTLSATRDGPMRARCRAR
jgi:predicted secreted protein